MGRLEGKVALVIGGAAGAGRDDVLMLAREGARVVITDIDEDAGVVLAREIGADALFLRHDVTSESDWRSVFDAVRVHVGRLDILVNDAAILAPGAAAQEGAQQWGDVTRVNADSCVLGCRFGVAAMRESGGSIINMAWVRSWLPLDTHAAYSAAKAAVGAMTRTTARHCREQGLAVRINSIHPGGIHYPLMRAAAPDAGADRLLFDGARQGGAEAAVPEQVADILLFLASDESRLVSGAEIRVDDTILAGGL